MSLHLSKSCSLMKQRFVFIWFVVVAVHRPVSFSGFLITLLLWGGATRLERCSPRTAAGQFAQLWGAVSAEERTRLLHRQPGAQRGRGERQTTGSPEERLTLAAIKVCLPLRRVRLCDPMDYSPLGSSVHGILQARILGWAAIPFSRGSSWLRDQTWVSGMAGRFFTTKSPWKPPCLLLGLPRSSLSEWFLFSCPHVSVR